MRQVRVSFVLRVSSSTLAAGRLAGEVEDVATGARGQFRDAEELAAWCARAAVPEQRAVSGARELRAVPSPAEAGDGEREPG